MTSKPPCPVGTGVPRRVTTSGTIPGKGRVAEPGLAGIAPGRGVIMMEPVSVCHHVSTTGQRSAPIVRWYHIQASGLIGSPTLPSRRNFERSCFFGNVSPSFMSARIAVGAV